MDVRDFSFDLPKELIAQTPLADRSASRLLVLNRQTGARTHRVFRDLPACLRAGDCLVINDTRVLPARLIGQREGKAAQVELLLLKRLTADTWETLVKPGRKAKLGDRLVFGDGLLRAEIIETTDTGNRHVRFEYDGVFEEILDRLGEMPLPPYITEKLADRARYQTVYAAHDGSAAAPTAGLHFTPELLAELEAKGVSITRITLHVGLGTFRPVKVERIEDHAMHSEYYEITEETAACINKCRANGGRVIAVGTTSCRTLESNADADGVLHAGSGWTDIFIYPGYTFRIVDGLVTNFHLPESTLIMLVSAFCGRENTLAAYEDAVQERYRFFSFGDAMTIL